MPLALDQLALALLWSLASPPKHLCAGGEVVDAEEKALHISRGTPLSPGSLEVARRGLAEQGFQVLPE